MVPALPSGILSFPECRLIVEVRFCRAPANLTVSTGHELCATVHVTNIPNEMQASEKKY